MSDKSGYWATGLMKSLVGPPAEEPTQWFRNTKLPVILPGTKEACGQGACGACTVMVSRYDWINKKILHFTVNACITPICYLHGMAVTTVEGVGGTQNGLHPIQKSLVESHGLQCGFCTPGMVMSMYTLFHLKAQPTPEQMERALEGNLCRCTGYRPIVEAFKNVSKECPCGLGLCTQSEKLGEQTPASQTIEKLTKDNTQHLIFPANLQVNDTYYRKSVMFTGNSYVWYRPSTLCELLNLKEQHPNGSFVMGCTFVRQAMKTGCLPSNIIVCGTHVPELHVLEVTDNKLLIGSAVTMATLEAFLEELIDRSSEPVCRTFKTLLHCIRWIGVDQVRNIATVGGHIMSDAPNHDLQTLFTALNVELAFQSKSTTKTTVMDQKFYLNGPGRQGNNELLTCITVPLPSKDEYVFFQKQPSRRGFDYAIVNAAMYISIEDNSNVIKDCRVCVGNVGKRPFLSSKAEQVFIGKTFDDTLSEKVVDVLVEDLNGIDGITDIQFKSTLAGSLLQKMCLQLKQIKEESSFSENLKSAIESCNIKPSTGIQIYDTPDNEGNHAVWQPIPNVTSDYIVSGEAMYVDDIPSYPNELFAATVTSTRSHANILNIDPSEALKVDGVVDFICRKDVLGENTYGIIIRDDELFADKKVNYYGQIVGAVLAKTREAAYKAVRLVNVEYEDLEAIYTIDEAIEKDSMFFYKFKLEDDGIDKIMSEADHVVEGTVETHAQEHLYLEPQSALAIPGKEQTALEVISSTQGINLVQEEVAHFLNVPRSRIIVKCKRAGGAFGGKASNSVMTAGIAAVGAWKTRRPVRCVFNRTTDVRTTGKRHPMKTIYTVGVSKEGKILGIDYKTYLNAGWNFDLSIPILDQSIIMSAYNIPCSRINGFLCKTNTPSNTATRGFGCPQGSFFIDNVMRKISHTVGKPLNMVKEINLVKSGDKLISKIVLEGINQQETWNQCKEQAKYNRRLQEIEKFNRENTWKKRGLAMTPSAFKFGYPMAEINQGYALVNIYIDGSVMVYHGGVEMGQGINTKLQQVTATALGIPMEKIVMGDTSTNVTPNTFETSASFGTDLNGGAVLEACKILCERLQSMKDMKPDGNWQEWIKMAYRKRINLSATGHFLPPGYNPGFDTKERKGELCWYYSHSAACAEVEIDCLTGEHQVFQVDIVMDIGKSLNPAIDIGQIEGGFVQGYGYLTTEAIYLNPNGQIKNIGPLDYKVPTVRNIPRKFNVTFLKESKGTKSIYSSKGIGEPPLLLAISVHAALQEAVNAFRNDSGYDGYYQLPCPATVEVIRMGCCDKISQKPPSKKDAGFNQITKENGAGLNQIVNKAKTNCTGFNQIANRGNENGAVCNNLQIAV